MNRFKKCHPALIGIAVVCMIAVFAEGDSYTSADDPLVTYSYVTQVLRPQLKQEILAELQNGNLSIGGNDSKDEDEPAPVSASYEVVHATLGQQILADDACEIILRSGSAKAISPFADQGLSDVSSGSEILNGKELSRNHYVIIPRGDGRGVSVTTNDAYFMIRGEYRIVG